MRRLGLALAVFVLGWASILSVLVQPAFAQSVLAQPLEQDIQIAQADKPKTLFDLLFGPREPSAPAKTPAPSGGSAPVSSPSVSVLPPAKPEVEKAADAKRLGVFGDSLAVDLANALEREYADDPDLVIVGKGVGSSGFVRDDFYNWNAAISEQIDAGSFDIAVVMIGINDRQPITVDGQEAAPLSDAWKAAYAARLERFLGQLKAAGKPVIWLGLPPMRSPSYSAAIAQISSLQKRAVFAAGGDFIDIYERFTGEDGGYSSYGPDLNGQNALMRKSDGIHFATAGADKLAFYVGQALKGVYEGGPATAEIADPLAGTDAAGMIRPPFQGLGQTRRFEMAGPVTPLSDTPAKASALVEAGVAKPGGFDMTEMVEAPEGRADAFGVGTAPDAASKE